MASVMLPLFLPEGVNFDKLMRALIGVALFSSAYMAEVVRGGLQAIPKGQYEAAQALGLSYWKLMSFIVLPQALKIVIPGIVNSFISLFKDTTLVSIVGLFDLLKYCNDNFQRREMGLAADGGDSLLLRCAVVLDFLLRNVALFAFHRAPAQYWTQEIREHHG